jgi:Spy/CpxP family protein refolding chaperone
MKQKILLIALIVSVALNLGAVGMFVIRGCAEREFGPGPHMLGEKLDLTREQRNLMRENRDEMKKQTEPIMDELGAKRSELIELLKEPELNTARRDELFKEITQLQVQLEILVFDHMYETARILTPEQREVFFEHLEGKFGPGPFLHGGPGVHGHHGGPHGAPHGHEGKPGRYGPPTGDEGESPPPPPDTE